MHATDDRFSATCGIDAPEKAGLGRSRTPDIGKNPCKLGAGPSTSLDVSRPQVEVEVNSLLLA
jgi:hypothetical protein